MPIFAGNPNPYAPPQRLTNQGGGVLSPGIFPQQLQTALQWMFGPPGREFPTQQTPRYGPRQRNLLDRGPDMPELSRGLPYGGGGQDIADVIPFIKRGLLNDPYTEMHEPGAGGRGLLGSKWRDPRFIQQYEVQQGMQPGTLRPVERAPASVTKMPENVDVAFKKAQAGHEAETARRIAARREAQGPTPAQMARPVKQTPEISAKLAEARAKRAGLKTFEEGLRPFRNMSHGMWGKMSAADRSAWLRDAKWKSWPVEDQRTFMERFMPQGIGP